MPRVHTQKANKDYPSAGIKKGDMYYSWSFRYGGKRISKTPPRPSQLTQSKMSEALAAGEQLEDTIPTASNPQELVDALNEAAEAIRAVGEEYSDSASNMAVQAGSVYEECEEKASNCEDWASSLEQSASDIEGIDDLDMFEKLNEEAQGEMMDEARAFAEENSSCPF